MWIEQRPFLLVPIQFKKKGNHYLLEGNGQKLEISDRQFQYFEHLNSGMSLQKIVLLFIKNGWLVSFRELYNLVECLLQMNWVLNPEIQSYFAQAKGTLAAGIEDRTNLTKKLAPDPNLLKKLPFFRTLPKEVQNVFIQNTSIQSMPANTRICKTGDTSRELFAMIEGTVGVYKSFPDGRRQLMSTIPTGSIFGEGGFLLGRARAADVICLQPSMVAIIQHTPEMDTLIDSGKAENLQRRFWVLQGMLASEIFSHVPTETLDSLVFTGKILDVKEGEIIVKEGDLGTSFYIVVQGSVAFTQKGKSLRALNQGGIFGEVALMVSGGKRTATAQAQRNSILLQIDMQEFYQILSNHLILAKEIETLAWKRWESRIK